MLDALNQKQVLFLISIALAAATLVAYEPIRHNGFVNYDDDKYITSNPKVSGGITRDSLIWAFTKSHYYMWHPLTTLTNMLDCQFFGLNPLGHHFISLLFHVANAILFFLILTNLTGSTSSPQAGSIWPSAFVAAVFALHPLQVESVAWASERKTVVSGFFCFLTIAVYAWYTKRPATGRYILLFGVYALCIMTKPVVVTLPLVLLLLDYWPLGRVKWGRHTESTPKEKGRQEVPVGRLIVEKIPLLALSIVLAVMTIVTQQSGGAVATLEALPLDYRIANIFLSYIKYICKIIWPSRLAVFYPYLGANFKMDEVAFCTLLFVLITAISIYIGRRRKYAAVGWLWFVGTLVPVIGLVQSGSQAMADRYMYMPMVGLLIIIGWAVKELIAYQPRWRYIPAVTSVVVLLSLVILTRMQVRHWQNSLTLFEHALKVTENNDLAESGYAFALADEGRLGEAELHLRKAVQMYPTYVDDRINLGFVFLQQGKFNEAIECLNKVIKDKPDSTKAYYFLAMALEREKKYDDAIKALASALKLTPNYPDARKMMGFLLLATGKLNEAIPYLNEALRTDARQVEIYRSLGLAYNQFSKYEQAIQNWTKAIELEPNNAEFLNNLAWVLATAGDISVQDANKAVGLAERACELMGYREFALLDTLAAAYAAAGRFDEAVRTAQQAIDIAKTSGQNELADEIQKRMELYKVGQPYRQRQNR
jgi:tetratricopeptide (TPR) repeat protein